MELPPKTARANLLMFVALIFFAVGFTLLIMLWMHSRSASEAQSPPPAANGGRPGRGGVAERIAQSRPAPHFLVEFLARKA